jgi:hypothetical protein
MSGPQCTGVPHGGTCTDSNQCGDALACGNGVCCTEPGFFCVRGSDCCSGSCSGNNCTP